VHVSPEKIWLEKIRAQKKARDCSTPLYRQADKTWSRSSIPIILRLTQMS
jgi:hypothetical protein